MQHRLRAVPVILLCFVLLAVTMAPALDTGIPTSGSSQKGIKMPGGTDESERLDPGKSGNKEPDGKLKPSPTPPPTSGVTPAKPASKPGFWKMLLDFLLKWLMSLLTPPTDETPPGPDTKPGDTKPGDTKPGDTKPGETKPPVTGKTPPKPIPMRKPVGREINMASPQIKQAWTAAMGVAATWNFPQVRNKYGQLITPADYQRAIIWMESRGVHQNSSGVVTRSWCGALGFGQFMPGTAKRFGIDPRDPAQNLKGSSRYFKALFDLKDVKNTADPIERLLKPAIGYNWGEGKGHLTHSWSWMLSRGPKETVGYGLKLKMCLGLELSAADKAAVVRVLKVPASRIEATCDDYYARSHGLI